MWGPNCLRCSARRWALSMRHSSTALLRARSLFRFCERRLMESKTWMQSNAFLVFVGSTRFRSNVFPIISWAEANITLDECEI
eukprot:16433455-Heterocapsa_arctica.AAC.1